MRAEQVAQNDRGNLPYLARRALQLAAGHLNVSALHTFTPQELLKSLQDQNTIGIADPRLYAFFNEIDTETLTDLVLSEAITYQELADGAALHLHDGHETLRWLDDRKAF